MNTKLLNAAILTGFASIAMGASAATSVTLYGRADVGYEYKRIDNSTTPSAITQEVAGGKSSGNNRFGIRGNEDLGNGLAATFQLEGRFDGDTGDKSAGRAFFDRESTVGIKGAFGHVRLGRSYATMDNALGFIDVGRRFSAYSAYNENWGVASRHSNALFYNYSKSGFTVGADVATKGGYDDKPGTTNEGVAVTKAAYGAFAKYKNANLEVGLGYQDDGIQASKKIRREWGVGAAYTFAPITVGASYARGNDDVVGGATEAKLQTISAFLSGRISANDQLYLVYRREGLKDTTMASGAVSMNDKITRYALGYVHSLSKRTSIYADVARQLQKDKTGASVAGKEFWGYDIALRHNF